MATIEAASTESADVTLEPADEPCAAESAECNCPDFCERDHDNE
jgi:hypothetical protein